MICTAERSHLGSGSITTKTTTSTHHRMVCSSFEVRDSSSWHGERHSYVCTKSSTGKTTTVISQRVVPIIWLTSERIASGTIRNLFKKSMITNARTLGLVGGVKPRKLIENGPGSMQCILCTCRTRKSKNYFLKIIFSMKF